MQFRNTITATAIAIMLCAGMTLADEPSYTPCAARPVKVGQLYSFTGTGWLSHTTQSKAVGARPANPIKYSAELNATLKVLAIEPNSL